MVDSDVMLEVCLDAVSAEVAEAVEALARTYMPHTTITDRGVEPQTVVHLLVSPLIISDDALDVLVGRIQEVNATDSTKVRVRWVDVVGGDITQRETIASYRWTRFQIRLDD